MMVNATGYMPATTIPAEREDMLAKFYRDNPNHLVSIKQQDVITGWYAFPGQNALRITDVINDHLQTVVAKRGEAGCNAREHGQGRQDLLPKRAGLTDCAAIETDAASTAAPRPIRRGSMVTPHRRRCRHPPRPRHLHQARHGRARRCSMGSSTASNAGSFDAVIDLGDRISDETAERDAALQREVAKGFRASATSRATM